MSRCVNSLVNQTYHNIEILLIDDGSTDLSKQICEEYEKRDYRVKVYTKVNGGVSSARNLGITLAEGQYITFVDGDDWVDIEYIKTLRELINSEDIDASSVTMYYWFSEDKVVKGENGFIGQHKCSKEEVLNQAFNPETPWVGFACGKLYRLEVIRKHNIKYDEEIKLCEDSLFNYNFFNHCKFCNINNNPLYFYRIRQSSATRSSKFDIDAISTKLLSLKKITSIAIQYPNTKFEERVLINRLQTQIYLLCLKKYKKHKIASEEKKDFKECIKISKKYQKRNDKIKILLLIICPRFLFFMIKKRNRLNGQ